MAKSFNGDIELDYNRAIAQARKLDEVAGDLESIASRNLETAEGCLRYGWKGDSAEIYIKKLTARKEKLSKTASRIRKIASAIREEAEKIMKQERMSLGRK